MLHVRVYSASFCRAPQYVYIQLVWISQVIVFLEKKHSHFGTVLFHYMEERLFLHDSIVLGGVILYIFFSHLFSRSLGLRLAHISFDKFFSLVSHSMQHTHMFFRAQESFQLHFSRKKKHSELIYLYYLHWCHFLFAPDMALSSKCFHRLFWTNQILSVPVIHFK